MEILERLTPRQAQFVREYVTGGNAAEAARRAGYSERTAKAIACELLTKPDLQEAIQALQAENALAGHHPQGCNRGRPEAVAMARVQGEPMAMIAGYRELRCPHDGVQCAGSPPGGSRDACGCIGHAGEVGGHVGHRPCHPGIARGGGIFFFFYRKYLPTHRHIVTDPRQYWRFGV